MNNHKGNKENVSPLIKAVLGASVTLVSTVVLIEPIMWVQNLLASIDNRWLYTFAFILIFGAYLLLAIISIAAEVPAMLGVMLVLIIPVMIILFGSSIERSERLADEAIAMECIYHPDSCRDAAEEILTDKNGSE